MGKNRLNITEISWSNALEMIKATSPNLANILEQCRSQHGFIKASYFYGNKILQNGLLNLPNITNGTTALNSNEIPGDILTQLNYSPIPLALVLTKSVEKYFETENRVMPTKIFLTSDLIGLEEFVNLNNPLKIESKNNQYSYNLSSGARSVFMLPKIADSIAHSRLKRDYGISAYPPKQLIQQAQVFSDLAQKNLKDNWQCEILFFTKPWLQEKELKQYCLEQAWQQSLYSQIQTSFSPLWEDFTKEVTRRNLKPKPYTINTLKHIMAIGTGFFPGFIATNNRNNTALPGEHIQNAYINSYELKKYIPTIMAPAHFNTVNQPVYYSLSIPTLLEYAPQAGNSRSIMADLRELKQLVSILFICLKNNGISNHISCDFFHSDLDNLLEIRPTNKMLSEDKNLIVNNQYLERDFADNSPFFRGCIRISKAK